MVKGIMGKFEGLEQLLSNPEENMCLEACVLGKNKNIIATLDPNILVTMLSLFAKRLAKGKLGGVVDDG